MRIKPYQIKLIIFVSVILAVVIVFYGTDAKQHFTETKLRENIDKFRDFLRANYIKSILIYISAYSILAAALPVASLLLLAGGILFGTFEGSLYSMTAVALSSAITFYFSRYFAGNWIQQRFGEKLEKFNENFRKYGTWYLISVRFIPIAPFCVLNLIAGLTRVHIHTFLWTTCLGSIPGVLIFTFIGGQLV